MDRFSEKFRGGVDVFSKQFRGGVDVFFQRFFVKTSPPLHINNDRSLGRVDDMGDGMFREGSDIFLNVRREGSLILRKSSGGVWVFPEMFPDFYENIFGVHFKEARLQR